MRIGLVACTILLGFYAGSALAQTQSKTGSLILRPAEARAPTNQALDSPVAARKVFRAYARCIIAYKRENSKILSYFETYHPPMENFKFLRKLDMHDDCLVDSSLSIDARLVRPLLFTELYRYSARNNPRPNLSGVVFQDYTKDVTGADGVDGQHHAGYRNFASCVIAKNHGGVRDLVMAEPGSSREAQAMRTMVPYMSACIPKGMKLNLNNTELIGILAEVAYREENRSVSNEAISPSGLAAEKISK